MKITHNASKKYCNPRGQYTTTLKHSSFGPLFWTGRLIEYKDFRQISLGYKPLLGGGYAKTFPLHMYMQLHGTPG